MWSKQRRRIDKLDDLRVGGLLLRDSRSVDGERYSPEEMMPVMKAWANLRDFMGARRPALQTCAVSTEVEDQYSEAYELHRRTNPDATTDDFDLVYAPLFDNTLVDPRLPTVTFVVEYGAGLLGGLFHLHNVTILEDSRQRLAVSAGASPAFSTDRGFLDPDDLGPLMRALLERDVPFADSSRVFDLQEWVFPSARSEHTWVDREGEDVSKRTLAYLADHNRTDIGTGEDRVPVSISRRALEQ